MEGMDYFGDDLTHNEKLMKIKVKTLEILHQFFGVVVLLVKHLASNFALYFYTS